MVGPQQMRWVLGVSFLAMAVWMLIPDKMEEEETGNASRLGVFATTVLAFFLAEMGHKMQIAAIMLAVQYQDFVKVAAGTTLGMRLANAPVVRLRERMTRRVPIRLVHLVSALIFAALGLVTLFGWA
jgi:Ca2+/H+ antiporter, TMEM165/GDT1 family